MIKIKALPNFNHQSLIINYYTPYGVDKDKIIDAQNL